MKTSRVSRCALLVPLMWGLGCESATTKVAPGSDAAVTDGGGTGGAGGAGGGGTGGATAGSGGAGGDGMGTGGSDAGADVNCGLVTVGLQRKPPEMLMVFDRSSSMNIQVPATMTTRFQEATAAITQVLTQTNDTVFWGLKLFPTGQTCGVTPGIDVPVGMQTAPAVTAAIAALPPGTPIGTPTHLAVAEATAQLKSSTTDNPKYILLATDGEPGCATAAEGGSTAASIAAVQAAATAGFHTFVIGIATAGTTADTVLNNMATAGGEARMGATKYYPASVRDELVAALTQITGQVTTCVFPLAQRPPSPDDVAVRVGTTRIDRDPANGWSYGANMNSIVLSGTACDLAKSGNAGNATIVFGCPGIVIP